MATGSQNQESLFESLRKQLALAVKSIQWSYGIFWSISTTQPGVLEWGVGYYNGDIRTRKTVQAMELNSDQINSQRSDQLRELYGSLVAAESSPQAKRPSAALSPEDLTDTEWYFLVCMSFVFNIDQGLPGRTLASGRPVWLCNAHLADSQLFNRSLLAKSASIQTVVCFPFLGGVVELGVTDLVLEDPSFIEYIKSSFLEVTKSIVSTTSTTNIDNCIDHVFAEHDHEIFKAEIDSLVELEEPNVVSANNSTREFVSNQAEDSFMVEGINRGVSQVQSWTFIDEDFSNHVNNSMNSSDCMSQIFVDSEKVVPKSKFEMINNHSLINLKDHSPQRLDSLSMQTHELQYRNVLSSLLKRSDQLILGPHFETYNKESSFKRWKEEGSGELLKFRSQMSQRLLKKALFEVGRMQGGCLLDSQECDGKSNVIVRPEADLNHDLPEKRQKERLEEDFLVLRSLIHSKSKVDEVSILDDTIQYMKDLETRIRELETCTKSTGLEVTTGRPQDKVEKTSDNCGTIKIASTRKLFLNKRKACDIEEIENNINLNLSEDSFGGNVNVSITEKNVTIEMHCPGRECLLFEAMDALNNLNLDSHSVQSSTINGIISLSIKSVFRGSSSLSAGMIRQVLQRIVQG